MTTKTADPEILNSAAREGLILLCDHATNHVPAHLDDLGLDAVALDDHIAIDIGAADVTRRMADMMGVGAVLAGVSRLVIDVNRDLSHAGLIPPVSDGIVVPGNRGLSSADTAARIEAYYDPFHAAAAQMVGAHLEAGHAPFLAGIHSFTPQMNGEERPWHIGLMWNRDSRLAQALIGILERETDLVIGANEPYSGKDLFHTLQTHGSNHGLPAVTVEIRNDLLRTPTHFEEWATLLAKSFNELVGREDLGRLSTL